MEKNNKQTEVKFKDKQNNLFKIEIEITHRNGYPEFSMSGEGNGSIGQCGDEITPANEPQKKLINIWKTYHLNGLHAGTEKQENKLKEITDSDYKKSCDYLNSFDKNGKPIISYELININNKREITQERIIQIKTKIETITKQELEDRKNLTDKGLWIKIPELKIKEFVNTRTQLNTFYKILLLKETTGLKKTKTLLEELKLKTLLYDTGADGKIYKYGETWHKIELPKDLWEQVEKIKKDIEIIEEKNKKTGGRWEDLNDYKKVALGKHLELTPAEAEEDITTEDDEIFNYCGTDYYVLTEEEAQIRCEEYLGDELWQMAVSSGNTELGKKEWIEDVIENDGFGQTLNGYDGTEYYDDENEVYIMRC